MVMKKWMPEATIYLSFPPLLLLYLRQTKKQFDMELSAIKPYFYLLFIGAVYEIIFTTILKVPACYWWSLFTILEFLALWYFFKKIFLKNIIILFGFPYLLYWLKL